MDEPKVNYIQSQRLMNNRLDEAHIRSWRDKGFALVHDLLPQQLLAALKQDLTQKFMIIGIVRA